MFPKIVREFDAFVVAELYADSKLPGKDEEHIALQTRLISSNSQPAYLILDPKTETVIREWD